MEDARKEFRDSLREGMTVWWKDPEDKASGRYSVASIIAGCGMTEEVTEETEVELHKRRSGSFYGPKVPVSQIS